MENFKDKAVGVTERWPGMLDGERFDLFCMKDEGYVITLMSTYGSNQKKRGQMESVQEEKNGETHIFLLGSCR